MSASNFLENINFQITTPQKGVILVSEPMLSDPNFFRSVVLLTKHDHEGSLGFVLNHISVVNVDNVLPEFSVPGIPIFIGGPVGNDQLFFIHTLGHVLEGAMEIMDGLFFGGDMKKLETLLNTGIAKSDQVRFFVGYSGWDPLQLNHEIEENSWIVAGTTPEQVMSDSDEYWKEVMIGLGKEFEILSRFPSNPELN
ncbi:MAG: YqgE/AlgH family protein [Salibacteraceae bacterium]